MSFPQKLKVFMLPSILVGWGAVAGFSQGSAVPLSVLQGVPLRLIVTSKVPFKKDHAVTAKVVEPVFSMGHEVVPSGTEVTGRITGFQYGTRWKRAAAILSGNFTPVREPQLEFDSLLLPGGKSMAISTSVAPGTDRVVRFDGGAKDAKKGRIATATEMARQQIEARKRAVIDTVKAPGKMDRIKDALWSFLPYHPQHLPAGSRFNAKLLASLDFGSATISAADLSEIGSQPPGDSVVMARLSTSLDSRTSQHGMPVEADLSRPLFSADSHLLFPEGSRLQGTVVQAKPARFWHRNGKLAFMFTGMEPPTSDAWKATDVRQIEGRLDSVEVAGNDGNVQLDAEGGTTVASSKKRFIAPALSLMIANRSLDNDRDKLDKIQTGASPQHYGSRIIGGGIGFGLIGSVIGRASKPFGAVLGYYGAARSIYTNIVGRGKEVTFPADTAIEIRFGPRP